jgi:dihydrofolate reductase
MAKLIYTVIMSLDGYNADKNGAFNWAEPDEEVHSFVNELVADQGTYLYGRRMYEVMAVWQTFPTHDQPSFVGDFANIWRAAEKVVYSTTLKTPSTPRTRIEPHFESEAVQRMKASAVRDVAIGGPTLAAHAFRAGLIDVCHLFIAPIIVGDGNPAFPSDIRLHLALQEERRFPNGMVYLHYRSSTSRATSPTLR